VEPAGVDHADGLQTIGEYDERDGRGQREAQPRGESTGQAGADDPERHADLTAGRARKELAERDEVGVVRLVDPPAPHDVLVAEVAEMRDRPTEGCETQARGGAEDLEQGTTASLTDSLRSTLGSCRCWRASSTSIPEVADMGSRTLHPVTTAEAYLELLADRGIDVFLGNAGTDFASLVEAFARVRPRWPRAAPLVIPHEFVAVSMAHGYYAAGGRPAAVMVHVNVGTGNASTAIITAAGANVPILMSAGRTPVTEEGLPGSRDLHIHWAQESFDQAAMLREYVKWDYELRTPTQIEAVGSSARGHAGRAARAGLSHAAARGAGRQPGRGDHQLAGAAPGAERALPGSGPHRRGGADPGARRVSDRPRLGCRHRSTRRRGTGHARRGGRYRSGGGRTRST
jgi:hypothetical protein